MEKYSDPGITLQSLQISDGDDAVKWYMDEKVRVAANTVFENWGHLVRLEAVVDVENAASQQVMEKAGFAREGVLESSDTGNGGGVYCSIQ